MSGVTWEAVPANEHHGAYVVTAYGATICDLYAMSQPSRASTLNGGPSRPVPFNPELQDDHARLIAAAPDLLEALEMLMAFDGARGTYDANKAYDAKQRAEAALAKARGEA